MVNFNDRVFVIGGWNTRDTAFELRECGLIPLRFRLPRDYRVHSCAVHDNRIWVCGSRDSPYACDSYDENWVHQAEKNTISLLILEIPSLFTKISAYFISHCVL